MKNQKQILLRYALCMTFVFFGSLSLFAQNLYDESRAVPRWFDEARYQIHQRFDTRIPDFDQQSNFYEAAELIANIKGGGIKVHTRHFKSAAEGAIWPSSVGGIQPIVSEKGNIAQRIIDSSHVHGLRIIAYYRHYEDSWILQEHPDWMCRDKNGNIIESNRGPMVSFASDYKKFLATRLLELTEMGADGFYFDGYHMPNNQGADFSEPSKKLFQERYGKSMLTASEAELLNFRAEVMAETFLHVKNELVAKKPDIVLLLSANSVRIKLLNDFYAKWEPNFYDATKSNRLNSLPIAATILRDATDGRPTHCWIAPADTDQSLAEVARYLTYNTIYNRDIREGELDETSEWKMNQQYKEQIELANKFSPHIAGKKPANFALIYIDENFVIRREPLPAKFEDTYNLFRGQMVSTGTITATQINEAIPSECRVICFPALTAIPAGVKNAVDKFKSGGGVVLTGNDITQSKIQELCQQLSGVHISGGVQRNDEDMDVAMYKSSDHQLLIALSNGPQQNISVQFNERFIPENVFEVISGEPLTVDMNDNGFTVHLDSFEAMAAISVDMRNYDLQFEFIDSSSENPVEGLGVIFSNKQYMTDSLGMIPLGKIPHGDYKIALADKAIQLLGNDIIEVFSDTLIRMYVKELPQYSVTLELLDSLSGNPLEGLELSLAGSTYVTNSEGMILFPELPEGNYSLVLPDERLRIAGNTVMEVRTDTMISIRVTKVPWLTFQVISRTSGSPLYRAVVEVNDSPPYYSNRSGLVEVEGFPAGPFHVSVSFNGYFNFSDTLYFSGDSTMVISLTPEYASVTFQVSDTTGPLGNAKVIMTGSQLTNFSGQALFFNQPARKNHGYSVEKAGYSTVQDSLYLEIDTTLEVSLEKVVGINSKDVPEWNIYPNPFDSYIQISLQEKAELKVYDISGILRLSMKLEEGQNRIHTGDLVEGFYLVEIVSSKRPYKKVMVK